MNKCGKYNNNFFLINYLKECAGDKVEALFCESSGNNKKKILLIQTSHLNY